MFRISVCVLCCSLGVFDLRNVEWLLTHSTVTCECRVTSAFGPARPWAVLGVARFTISQTHHVHMQSTVTWPVFANCHHSWAHLGVIIMITCAFFCSEFGSDRRRRERSVVSLVSDFDSVYDSWGLHWELSRMNLIFSQSDRLSTTPHLHCIQVELTVV